MKYNINANIKNILLTIDSKMSEIEVKGDSVEKLFSCRIMIKELFSNIKEEAEEKEE